MCREFVKASGTMAAAALLALAATAADAASISFTDNFATSYPSGTPASVGASGVPSFDPPPVSLPAPAQTLSLEKFNASLGTLTGAQLDIGWTVAEIGVDFSMQVTPVSLTAPTNVIGTVDTLVYGTFAVALLGDSGSASSPAGGATLTLSGMVAPGAGPASEGYTQPGVTPAFSFVHSLPAQLLALTGAGSFFDIDLTLDLIVDLACAGQAQNCSLNTVIGSAAAWTGYATVTYFYDTPRLELPEPATLPVLALGLLGLVALRRSRRLRRDRGCHDDLNQDVGCTHLALRRCPGRRRIGRSPSIPDLIHIREVAGNVFQPNLRGQQTALVGTALR